MKNVFKYLTIAAASMICLVSCFQEKSEIPVYEPAALESGAQVFFKDAPTTLIKLSKSESSLDILLVRASADKALSVGIAAEGDDALTYFNVPASVDFAADAKEATLTISAKDVDAMPMNEYYPLTISIADPTLITAYGTSSFSFEIGISLPWIKFSDGLLHEDWWGEEEEDMVMYYQQISETLRYCKIDGCWGHETGPSYKVQPYIWYWNTETNACYIPEQYMGYSSGANDMYISDEPGFYNLWWNKSAPGKNGSGQVAGTDAWFTFCDNFRATYPEDYYPYYDGAGHFYLADYGFWMSGGVPTGSGAQFGGDPDVFTCSFASDYTIELTCDGILQDNDGVAMAAGSVAFVGEDVAAVAVAVVAGTDVNDAVPVITSEAEEVENRCILEASGAFQVPVPEIAQYYVVLAAPYDAEGEIVWDNAVYDVIAYKDFTASISISGPVINPDDTGTATIGLKLGADTKYVMFAVVPGKGDDVVNAAIEGIDEDGSPFVKYYEDATIVYDITEVGDYTVIAVPYALGEAWTPAIKSFNFDYYELVGTGTLVDDVAFPLFGEAPVTVPCTIYNHLLTPGKYKIKDYSLQLACVAFESSAEELLPYEDVLWSDVDLIIDATDPENVSIGTQNYGICLSTSYGFVWVTGIETGTLANGIISFPQKGLACGFNGSIGYYANNNAAFMVAMPGVEIPSAAPASVAAKSDLEISALTPVNNKVAVSIEKGLLRNAKAKSSINKEVNARD